MERLIRIWLYLSLAGLAVYHVVSGMDTQSCTWIGILYYVSDHGLKAALFLFIWSENRKGIYLLAAILFALKMIYHISKINTQYNEYLESLHSEFWSGFFTIFILIFIIVEHEKLAK